MENIVISKKERYKILPPKSLIIGDNSYLERIEEGNNSLRKYCTILRRVPRIFKSELVFYAEKAEEYITYVARIHISKSEEINQLFYEDSYHPELLSYSHNLGCDTASYEIYVNKDRYEHINTGADGQYGFHMAYKNGEAHLLEISFSEEMYSEAQVRKMLSYLFNVQHEELLTSKIEF